MQDLINKNIPKNNLHEIMEDGYKTLLKVKRFPKELDIEKRLQIYSGMKEYFLSIEDYTKCNVIQNQIDKLNKQLKGDD